MTIPVGPPVALPTQGGTTPARETAVATRAAQSFERVLLEQLTTQLAATAAPGEDASPATAAYRDMLPGAMAEALSAAGGIGIAAQLATATAPPTPVADAPTSPASTPTPSQTATTP